MTRGIFSIEDSQVLKLRKMEKCKWQMSSREDEQVFIGKRCVKYQSKIGQKRNSENCYETVIVKKMYYFISEQKLNFVC